jgi:hypothetical protein
VADPGCLSRIPDLIFTHPGSRISDPGSKNSNKERGGKKRFFHTFLCSHKFHKIEHFSFEVLKKKIWANFQRIIELLTQKIATKLSKIWLWDPGSEIRDPEKTYSGSRGQKGTGSRIRIRNTGKWITLDRWIQRCRRAVGAAEYKYHLRKTYRSNNKEIYVIKQDKVPLQQ